jgi:hypothetical protein
MLQAYHNDPDKIIHYLINNKIITVNKKSGEVNSKRWNKPLGCFNSKGYKVCTLHYNKVRIQAKIHRIVWIDSNGIIPKGYVIDHINGIKSDNRISNLRLADSILNSRNRRNYSGINNPSAKINYLIANNIRKEYKKIKSYRKTAKLFNVSATLIAKIVRRELWN